MYSIFLSLLSINNSSLNIKCMIIRSNNSTNSKLPSTKHTLRLNYKRSKFITLKYPKFKQINLQIKIIRDLGITICKKPLLVAFHKKCVVNALILAFQQPFVDSHSVAEGICYSCF